MFNKGRDVDQDIRFEIHEPFFLLHLVVVVGFNEGRKSEVNFADNIEKNQILQHWRHFLILDECEVLLVLDGVPSLAEVVGDDGSVLVVK